MPAARIYQSKGMWVKLPVAVLALVAMVALWVGCLPLPPSQVTISSGLPEGVYHQYARQYADEFARNGIELDIAASDGSATNLLRLRGLEQPRADLAFVQGGMGFDPGERQSGDRVETIARIDTEPLWIFARSPLDSLEQFQNLRVSLGPKGSGTRKLGLALLRQVRIGPSD